MSMPMTLPSGANSSLGPTPSNPPYLSAGYSPSVASPSPSHSRSHPHSRSNPRSRPSPHASSSSSASMQSSSSSYQRGLRSQSASQMRPPFYLDADLYYMPPYTGTEPASRYDDRPMVLQYPRERVIYPANAYPAMHTPEAPQVIVKGTPLFNFVKQRVDAAVALKRTDMPSAKAALEKLCQEYPQCYIVWMELSRLEMDQGNISRCREVVLKGLEMLPRNESLLEKRVKVEERLRNVDGVIQCVEQFLAMNNSQCVKSIVEAAIVVAKLGCGYKASALFDSLIEHNLFTQGGVTLDYIRFVFKTESYDKGLRMLKETLTKLTKLGPIWFFTFSVLEQNHTITWNRGDIRSRPCNEDLKEHLQQALRCILDELKWKVYYIAAQAQLRSFTHIRLWTRTKKRYLRPYCATYPEVIRSCFDSLRCCIQLCLTDYKWKVWLLAGRVQALAGKRHSSIRVAMK